MQVKLVIDGQEIVLLPAPRDETEMGYDKFTEPEPFKGMGLGISPVIATVYVKAGWKPSPGKEGG